MRGHGFQYRLSSMHLVVACWALVLGAAHGVVARLLIVSASLIFVLAAASAVLVGLAIAMVHGIAAAQGCPPWWLRFPSLARQAIFERRLARVRPGNPSSLVRRRLGSPTRIDGFGDVVYWSYRVAGQRYTVSLDPRRLVAKYSNGLARDTSARSGAGEPKPSSPVQEK